MDLDGLGLCSCLVGGAVYMFIMMSLVLRSRCLLRSGLLYYSGDQEQFFRKVKRRETLSVTNLITW